jgi:hypothetical protein
MIDQPSPDVLEVYIGSFGARAYGVWWDGEQLVYESFGDGYEDRRQTVIAPSEAQWARFWRTMDEIDVWSWRPRYEAAPASKPLEGIRDGTHWSLTLHHGGRGVESAGDTAGPGAAELSDSARFDAFAEAVSRLLGGYRFS